MTEGGEPVQRDAWKAESYHRPVLLDEVIAALEPSAGRVFFDGTAGGGGHSEAILEAGARVVACDRDPAALDHSRRRLERFSDRFTAFHGAFAEMREWLDEAGIDRVDGVLLDLGVSSRHLDDALRGFSFQKDGPLDMRMDTSRGRTAADLVNEEDEDTLREIFRDYGEERGARRVAAKIVSVRADKRIETTLELADVVASVIPRHSAKHPATRVFQALRIAVNEELRQLEKALEAALLCVKPGGRLAVISFHSLEDRIVKRFFKRHSLPMLDRPEWPAPRPNPDWHFERRLPKSVAPGREETRGNPRARSARLRVAQYRQESSNEQS